jgi:hypothetical protein
MASYRRIEPFKSTHYLTREKWNEHKTLPKHLEEIKQNLLQRRKEVK